MIFYDKHGSAIAYYDDGLYEFSGKPLAYFSGDAVYSYGGRQLGWIENGWIYDLHGRRLLFTRDAIGGPLKPLTMIPPLKGLKQLKPLKGVPQLKRLRPVFSLSWSEVSSRQFFAN